MVGLAVVRSLTSLSWISCTVCIVMSPTCHPLIQLHMYMCTLLFLLLSPSPTYTPHTHTHPHTHTYTHSQFKEKVVMVLNFTALLIEHSYARHIYNSTEVHVSPSLVPRLLPRGEAWYTLHVIPYYHNVCIHVMKWFWYLNQPLFCSTSVSCWPVLT